MLRYTMHIFFVISGLCSRTRLSRPCSSLDGPYCMHVNNKAPPILPKIRDASIVMQHEPPQSHEDRLSEAIGSLADIIKPIENMLVAARRQKPVDGSFRINGFVKLSQSTDPIVKFRPGKWIKRPSSDWMTVGLDGTLTRDKHTTFAGKIMSDDDKPLASCSRFSFKLEGTFSGQWTPEYFKRLWTGTYTCTGTKTFATLNIKTARMHETGPHKDEIELSGLFNFTVGKRPNVETISPREAFEQAAPLGQDAIVPLVLVVDEETGQLRQVNDRERSPGHDTLREIMQRALQEQLARDDGGVQVVNLDLGGNDENRASMMHMLAEQLQRFSEEGSEEDD